MALSAARKIVKMDGPNFVGPLLVKDDAIIYHGALVALNSASGFAIEQFGYGFGFTAYMLYMIMVVEGEHKTAHFAICTGFMALGMMLPGMWSGWLQDTVGYRHFFLWVILSTIPGFLVAGLVRIDPQFGRKKAEAGK